MLVPRGFLFHMHKCSPQLSSAWSCTKASSPSMMNLLLRLLLQPLPAAAPVAARISSASVGTSDAVALVQIAAPPAFAGAAPASTWTPLDLCLPLC